MALNIDVFQIVGDNIIVIDLPRAIEQAFRDGYQFRTELDREIEINGLFNDAGIQDIGEEENLEWICGLSL